MTHTIDRRCFLKLAAAASASVFVRPYAWGGAASAVRVGVVGVGRKGWEHVKRLLGIPGVRLVALCDADRAILDRCLRDLDKLKVKPASFVDYRKMLELKDLDAVVVATPNHQHTLQTIWACQAGKDVYVEKPVSHNLFESAQIARAATKYGRIVQAGTQKRSDLGHAQGFKYIREGNLGKIRLVRGFCHKLRNSIGKVTGPQPIPATVDYNLWSGPAPMEPLLRQRFHYDWHWFWTTGNGDIGNQGPHELDIARWALGETGLPRRVISVGGRLGYRDDGQTPNTQLVLYDYPTAPVLFEVCGLPAKPGYGDTPAFRGIRIGNIIECEHGSFVTGDGGGWILDNQGKKVKQFSGDGGATHMANFIEAVRTRRPESLAAPVREGAVSAGLIHLGNLSHRVGKAASPQAIHEKLAANHDANESFNRILGYLAANNVDPAKTPLTVGGWLEWDDKGKRFTGGEGYKEANEMVTRNYRAPFVVPAKL